MFKKQISIHNFIFTFIAIFAVLTFPYFFNFFFLQNIGEFLNEREIYEKQNLAKDKKIIYGSGIFDDIKALKIYSFYQKKPKVIALGSSRALAFRESFFKKDYYNMGYIISSINDLENFIYEQDLEKIEVLILAVDFWWFRKLDKEEKPPSGITKTHDLSVEHLILPYTWLKNKKITFANYKKYILEKSENIGLRGALFNSGFAPDGSNYYTDIISGQSKSFNDSRFSDTLKRVRTSSDKFEHGNDISELDFNKFLKVFDFLKGKNVKVIFFLPPLASRVNTEMKNYDYSYIEKLKKDFSDHNINIYDFTEADKVIQTNDCEFIDGFHGGDVLYAKILDQISNKEPFLDLYIDKNYLKTAIKNYNGLAMIPDKSVCRAKEIDFLKLGCPKK